MTNQTITDLKIRGEDVSVPNVQPTQLIAGFTRDEVVEMAKFAAFSYNNPADKPSEAGSLADFKKDGYKVIPFNNSYEHAGYIFAKDNDVIIAYHGTKNMDNLITDLNAVFATSAFTPGRLHCGFYRAFKDSAADLYQKLDDYAKSRNTEVRHLNAKVTGHSLGGAQAKISGFFLNNVLEVQNIKVCTFGAPRVFDVLASNAYKNTQLGENTLNVIHPTDPVTYVGPAT